MSKMKDDRISYSVNNKKKILITGGTGYLGSNIINALKDKYAFILLKRRTSNLKRISDSVAFIDVYNIEEFDIEAAEHLQIDILLHCATHYGRKDLDPVNTIDSNLLLPLRLLSLFKRLNRKIKFINTDTILDKHINAYSLSKNQFKEWMKYFSDDIVFLNIQLEHFYGPSDDKTKFVSFLIDAFLNNTPVLDLTKGEQNRYFTFIDDIVSAFEIIIDKINQFPFGLTEFQVSADEPVNLKTFITMVKRIAGNEITKLNFGSVPYREGELMNFKIDSTEIRKLGWSPLIDLEQGLRKTIEIDKKQL